MSWTMENIFHCTMSKWPVSMLIHKFFRSGTFTMYMRQINPYSKCLNRKNITSLAHCQVPIKTLCGKVFNSDRPATTLCQRILWNNGTWKSTENEIKYKVTQKYDQILKSLAAEGVKSLLKISDITHAFQSYFKCVEAASDIVKTCAIEHLDKPCEGSKIRTIKTVRSTIFSDQRLMKYDNFRLIHLFRDPRGTARSRSKKNWSQGIHERRSVTREAQSYCHGVHANNKIFTNSKTLQQNATKSRSLIYDEFVEDPQKHANDLFTFLDFPIPQKTTTWLENHTRKKSNHTRSSATIAKAWQGYYKEEDLRTIWKACQAFFSDVSYDWR